MAPSCDGFAYSHGPPHGIHACVEFNLAAIFRNGIKSEDSSTGADKPAKDQRKEPDIRPDVENSLTLRHESAERLLYLDLMEPQPVVHGLGIAFRRNLQDHSQSCPFAARDYDLHGA